MDSELETHPDIELLESPASKWIAWAIWSGISLVMVLLAVLGAGFDTGLLPGWAVGIIVAGMIMVFSRK